MTNEILLSILIPTRNREKYAIQVIKHILEFNNNNFQLVIQDNSDSKNLEILLDEYECDSRLNYFYCGNILSFVDNFNLGISNCKGQYLTIIGDDDGINGEIFDITYWASLNKIDAISPSLSSIYFWPKSGVNREKDNGRLTIDHLSSNMSFRDTKKELIKFLNNGCHNYLNYNLGKAYHGVIKKSVLEKIKIKTGRYVGGLSPDIYLSIAISLIIDKVLIIDYPLTISGICKKSGSSDSATGRHTGSLNKAPHFIGNDNYIWSKNVPPFYCVETIWADSALAAINDLNKLSYLNYYNQFKLSAYCIKTHKDFKSLILSHLKSYKHKSNSTVLNFKLSKSYLSIFINKKIRFLSRIIKKIMINNSKVYFNIKDINTASILCNEFLVKQTKTLQTKKIKFSKKRVKN